MNLPDIYSVAAPDNDKAEKWLLGMARRLLLAVSRYASVEELRRQTLIV